MVASEVASFETNFFRIAGTLDAETSVNEKVECLSAIGEEKEGSRFRVIVSFKEAD